MTKRATLHRMVLPNHVCPYGERAKAMLEDEGYEVDDRHLTTREQVDSFKAEHDIPTTPLILISGKRILGSDELEAHLKDRAGSESQATTSSFGW
jgi:glutaredoxin 3